MQAPFNSRQSLNPVFAIENSIPRSSRYLLSFIAAIFFILKNGKGGDFAAISQRLPPCDQIRSQSRGNTRRSFSRGSLKPACMPSLDLLRSNRNKIAIKLKLQRILLVVSIMRF